MALIKEKTIKGGKVALYQQEDEMADQVITITVPSDKVAVAVEGYLKIYPNREMTEDEVPVAKYTDAQWVREQVRRLFIRDVRRGLQMLASEAAQVESDDSIAT